MSRRLLVVLIAVLVFGIVLQQAMTRWGAANAHQRFLTAIEKKNWPTAGDLISESYSDQFGFGPDEVVLAARDVSDQFFLTFTVKWTEVAREVGDGEVRFSGNIAVSGSGTPIAAEIIRMSSRHLKEPVQFLWKQESVWPWSWRLHSIDLPSLELPGGYQPGSMELDLLEF